MSAGGLYVHLIFYSESIDPYFTSLQTLSVLLDITERRVQQLADEGIVVRKRQGHYDLVASIQGYVRYLRAQAQKKKPLTVEEELASIEWPLS